MRRYFSRMHKRKGSGRALGLNPFFGDGLYFFIFNLHCYFRILILYTTDFNPRINKDIIIINIIIIIIIINCYYYYYYYHHHHHHHHHHYMV